VHPFDEDKLRDLLASRRQLPNLVVVSACMSEKIGDIFIEAKVPAVISVNYYDEVADDIALEFAKHLYSCLYDG
jgi:hypothetical protein